MNKVGGLVSLASVDNAGANKVKARLAELCSVESIELGAGDRLGNLLLGHGAVGNALQSLNGSLGTGTNRGSRARQLNSQEAGIRVRNVGSRHVQANHVRGGLGEQAVAGRPLDGGLAAEESGQDSDLGLGRSVGGPRESNDHGIATGVGCALLTTVVLGRSSVKLLARLGRGLHVIEELADPLGDILRAGAVGDEGKRRLGVDSIGEASNVLLVQVLLGRRRRGGVDGGTQTSVEGNRVGVVEGEGSNVVVEVVLLDAQNRLNLLVELVS